MKKIGILNSEISRVISGLGHTDQIVVCDAGFPIPSHVERIICRSSRAFRRSWRPWKPFSSSSRSSASTTRKKSVRRVPTVQQQIDKVLADVERKTGAAR